jgi:hypothetical protein
MVDKLNKDGYYNGGYEAVKLAVKGMIKNGK